MDGIAKFFEGTTIDRDALAAWLDGLDATARKAAIQSLTAKQQARLFEAEKGFRALTLEDFVPASRPAMAPVIHHGKNSLPLLTHFQKRFCRPAEAGKLWGYNHQEGRPAPEGPGYFVVKPSEGGEVVIDYTELPGGKAEGWPPIKNNRAGLSRFVYYGMHDYMRGVSKHVTVGRANRHGKWTNNYFVLCRED